MGEISRRFDSAKEDLRQLSRTAPRDVRLPSVSESGTFLGFTDHNVTGAELNRLTRSLQSALSTANENIRQIARSSAVTYQLADALESDYLAKFQVSIKEALYSGQKAEEAATKALKAQKTADGSIAALRSSLDALTRTNKKLEDFRQQAEDRLRALEREKEERERKLSRWIEDTNRRLETLQSVPPIDRENKWGASYDNTGKILWVTFGIAVAALVIALVAGVKSFVG